MKKIIVAIIIIVILAGLGIGGYYFVTNFLNNDNNSSNIDENTLIVSFDTDGAEELDQMTLIKGSDDYNLPTPSKTGYIFNGWFIPTRDHSWVIFDENYQVIGRSIEVTAKWNNDTQNYNFFNISFNTLNLTSNPDNKEIVEDIAIGELPEPASSGVKFSGWFVNDGRQNGEWGSEITSTCKYVSDVTLYAKWVVIVSFNTMGGTVVSDEEIGYSKVITLPNQDNFSKVGFDFVDWYTDSEYESIYDNSIFLVHKTLYAQWEAQPGATIYTVNFVTNGARENLPDFEVGEGATIPNLPTADDVQREMYVFEGWFVSNNEGETLGAEFTTSSLVNRDMILYAKWERVDTQYEFFTVSFNTQNGNSIPSIDVVENSYVGLPNDPIREGYVFDGWYLESDCNNLYGEYSNSNLSLPRVTASLTLYAKWFIIYTIAYNLDGGTNNINNITKYSELDLPISLQPPTKIGQFVFDGWFDNSELTGQAITEITLFNISDLELNANWSDPLIYEYNTVDSAYYVTDCNENYSGAITISDNYNDGINGNKIVSKIDDRAFYNRPHISSLTITDNVKDIGQDAFYGCKGLLSVILPSSLISIKDGAFRDCLNLATIDMSNVDNLENIGEYVFNSTVWLNNQNEGLIYFDISNDKKILYDCKGDIPQNVVIEDGTTVIPTEMFRNNTTLESISFPSSITEIQEGVFWGCTNLSSVIISESIESIGTEAFRNCTSLNSIFIPKNVVSMGDMVFSGCSTNVNCEADEDGGNDMPLNADGYIYSWSGYWTSPHDSITINWGQLIS